MRKTFIIFVLLSVSYECHGGLLQGILEGAHEVRKHIHGAAGAVLGGISNGLNINGHFGINTQHDNNNIKPDNPPQTVVVIVNENANDEGPPAHQNKYPNQNRPQNYIPQENDLYQNGNWNNQNNPPNHVNNISPQHDQSQYNTPNGNNNNHNGPNFGNGNQNNLRPPNRPIYGQSNNPGYENQNQNNYGKPNSGANYQPGYGNQNQNSFEQTNKPHFNQNNGYGFDNINQDSQPNQSGFDNFNNNNGQTNPPNHVNNIGPQHNQDQYNNEQANKPEHGQFNRPNENNNIWPKPTDSNDVQHTPEKVVGNDNKKPDHDDEPLFIPLTPNEYVYGGDKIHVETPKRETENKPKPADDDEEFLIDVRIKEE